MHANTFRGRTIHDAMTQVKSRFGPDALILATRQSRPEDPSPFYEIDAVPSGTDIATAQGDSAASPTRFTPMRIDELMALFTQYTHGIMEEIVRHPKALSLYTTLIRNGIQERLARGFIEKAGCFQAPPNDNGDDLSRRTAAEIAGIISTTEVFSGSGDRPMAAAVIGTTGVGKTTTIAKIAAQLMLRDKKKVGLISVDTYRIGAFEQLGIYSKILGIPCYQAFNPKDLQAAITRLRGYDVILIDTAGQSQYDRRRISELREILTDDLSISCHLCLSVATESSEMDRAVQNFGPLKFSSLIFTKVDEAERCGAIVNQLTKTPYPVSYLTTGQNVPEDIETADKGKIVRLMFRTPSRN